MTRQEIEGRGGLKDHSIDENARKALLSAVSKKMIYL